MTTVSRMLLVGLAGAAFSGAAMADTVLPSYNFNSYTSGNLGTDTTGVTPGQGGWYTYSVGGTSNTAYTIVNDPVAGGTHGKSLKMTGGTSSTAFRDVWNNDLANTWGTQPANETKIVLQWDMYVAQSNSTTYFGTGIFDSTFSQYTTGLFVVPSTGTVYGVAHYNDPTNGPNNYIFNLGTVTRNAWHTYQVTFDQATGIAEWFYQDATNGASGFYVQGDLAGTAPAEYDLLGENTAATVAGTAYFDNIAAVTTTPAPASLALMGLGGLVAGRRRR